MRDPSPHGSHRPLPNDARGAAPSKAFTRSPRGPIVPHSHHRFAGRPGRQRLSAAHNGTGLGTDLSNVTEPLPNRNVLRRPDRPRGVGYALIALGAAWVVSAIALFVNQVVFHGSGVGPGPSLGIGSLVMQAVVFWLVGRGNPVARVLVIVFSILATLPLQLVPRLIDEREVFSASYTVLGFLLKGAAVWLLFTGESAKWFGNAP